jgi:UDP-glucuronate 4-epimerase
MITGAAGFIGSTLAKRLLERGDTVTGVDNLNDYYEVSLKEARLARLTSSSHFSFIKADIADRDVMSALFAGNAFDSVVNLAAQAGVRYSIENPAAYIDANLVGFGNILEGCRQGGIRHLVYASSSSVYGSNTKLPFSEKDNVDHPISLYAASKKANELMAHAYAHLYGLPTTGLRFFTVYGPWGRPDMALFKFTKGILEGQPIPVYNRGQMVRDFTYIDDIVEGVIRVLDQPPGKGEGVNEPDRSASAPWRIYNIGNSARVQLMDYIRALEKALGRKATLELLPMQDGDVPATEADVSALESDFGYRPQVGVEEGIKRFVEWYRCYYSKAG